MTAQQKFRESVKSLDRIVLHGSSSGWVAESFGPHADEIVALFGTNVIPTAFTSRASGQDVKEAIQKLNPGVDVVLGAPIRPRQPLLTSHGEYERHDDTQGPLQQ